MLNPKAQLRTNINFRHELIKSKILYERFIAFLSKPEVHLETSPLTPLLVKGEGKEANCTVLCCLFAI